MERIAYESVNIITPFKLITFSLRNNILLQPQLEDLNKMYFFDQVIYIYICIYLYIYKKLSPEWKNVHKQKVFHFRFYILCENFSKIGPIIKKIPNFSDDPLNCVRRVQLRRMRIDLYRRPGLSKKISEYK